MNWILFFSFFFFFFSFKEQFIYDLFFNVVFLKKKWREWAFSSKEDFVEWFLKYSGLLLSPQLKPTYPQRGYLQKQKFAPLCRCNKLSTLLYFVINYPILSGYWFNQLQYNLLFICVIKSRNLLNQKKLKIQYSQIIQSTEF